MKSWNNNDYTVNELRSHISLMERSKITIQQKFDSVKRKMLYDETLSYYKLNELTKLLKSHAGAIKECEKEIQLARAALKKIDLDFQDK